MLVIKNAIPNFLIPSRLQGMFKISQSGIVRVILSRLYEGFLNFFFLIYTANCASCEIHVKFMWNSCLYHVKVMFIWTENRVKNFTWKSCTFYTNLTWISCKAKCLWNKEFWKFYYFLFLLKLLKKVNKLTFYK